MSHAPADYAALVRHADFARRLARSLVGDPHLAEDVVQETWLAALRRPPRVRGSERSFLATLVRRISGRHARTEARLARREQAAARAEALPSSADLCAAMEVHRDVVEAVLALEEPYRGTLLLRFFDDLPPRAIAAREGVPVETVRTRVKRGLARVRSRLEESADGESRSWHAALALLAHPSGERGAAVAAASVPTASGLATLFLGVQAKLALGAAALVVLLAGWWALGGGGVEPPREPLVDSVPVDPVTLEEPSGTGHSEPRTDAPERAPVSAETPVVAAEPEPVPPTIAGTIVLVDENDAEHTAENGSFRALFQSEPWQAVVVVEDGRFELPRTPTRELQVQELVLGGRPAWLDTFRVPIPTRGPLELRARRARGAPLYVVDAATGLDLTDVLVLHNVLNAGHGVYPHGWALPHVLLDHQRSPIPLPPRTGAVRYWVHAPGYGWKSVRIDHDSGGERVVRLERIGARLLVHVPENPPRNNEVPRNPHVRVYSLDPEETGAVAGHGTWNREARFRGLPAGRYEVRAEFGLRHEPKLVLDRAEIVLVQGEEAQVVLDYDFAVLDAPPAPLAGRIVLPAGREGDPVELWIRPLDRPALRHFDVQHLKRHVLEPLEDRPEVLQFAAQPDVTPGRYVLVVPDYQFEAEVEIPRAGRRDVELVLPALADVELSVVDEASGASVELGSLSWRSASMGPEIWMSRGSGDGGAGFRLSVPPGWIEVRALGEEWAVARRAIDVPAGGTSVVLRATRATGFWLRLLDGDVPVPIGLDTRVRVTHDGDVRTHRGRHAVRTWIPVTRAGEVLVEIEAVDGFLPIQERRALVAGDGSSELDVRLERVR